MPRRLLSVRALGKGTAPARCIFLSAYSRGTTCQRWPSRIIRCYEARAGAPLRSLSLVRWRSTRACCAHAPRTTLRRLLSVNALGKGATPPRDLCPSARGRGATCQRWPSRIRRLSRGTRERATALAVSRQEAQHPSLLRARTVSRQLLLVYALGKNAAPARGLSPSAYGHGTMCQWWPPTTSRLSRGMRRRATALAVSQQVAQHASLLRARTMPCRLLPAHALGKETTPAKLLSHLARGRGATCPLRPPRISRLWCHARARCLSGGGAALELAEHLRRAALADVDSCAR